MLPRQHIRENSDYRRLCGLETCCALVIGWTRSTEGGVVSSPHLLVCRGLLVGKSTEGMNLGMEEIVSADDLGPSEVNTQKVRYGARGQEVAIVPSSMLLLPFLFHA